METNIEIRTVKNMFMSMTKKELDDLVYEYFPPPEKAQEYKTKEEHLDKTRIFIERLFDILIKISEDSAIGLMHGRRLNYLDDDLHAIPPKTNKTIKEFIEELKTKSDHDPGIRPFLMSVSFQPDLRKGESALSYFFGHNRCDQSDYDQIMIGRCKGDEYLIQKCINYQNRDDRILIIYKIPVDKINKIAFKSQTLGITREIDSPIIQRDSNFLYKYDEPFNSAKNYQARIIRSKIEPYLYCYITSSDFTDYLNGNVNLDSIFNYNAKCK